MEWVWAVCRALSASGRAGDMLKGAEDVKSRLKLIKGVFEGLLGGLQDGWGDATPEGEFRTDMELFWPATCTSPSTKFWGKMLYTG